MTRLLIVEVHHIRVKAGLCSFDRCCGLFRDLSVCPYIVYAVIHLWFIRNVLFNISGA